MKYFFSIFLFTVNIHSFENSSIKIISYKKNNITVGIINRIIIKLDNNQTLNKYLSDFNLTKIKKLGKNLFLVEVKDNTLTIDTANQLTQMKGIKYAHPDFIKKRIKR